MVWHVYLNLVTCLVDEFFVLLITLPNCITDNTLLNVLCIGYVITHM
jgi:hypothetical protein